MESTVKGSSPVTATAHDNTHSSGGGKEIRNVTIILTVLTLIELALGYSMIDMANGGLKHFIKGAIIILMLAKAFYIVAYFMHLRYERRNMVLTITIPLSLFIWFIIAFLSDGNSFNHLRNTYDPYHKERSEIKVKDRELKTEH